MNNVDSSEVDKFSRLSDNWWDPNGELKTLHQVNPLRLEFIKKFTSLDNKNIIDIGCGGGILTESLATKNNKIYGLDPSAKIINIARQHAKNAKLDINYINSSIENFVTNTNNKFDIITCMETLEHVPNPESIIASISQLANQKCLFFASTLNRNFKSYLLSILAAEHFLKIIPKGTHQYSKFIKPYELTEVAAKYKFIPLGMVGVHYNPITGSFKLGKNTDVNYIIAFQKV